MSEPQIIIYSTSWCGFCRSEREYLDSKHIPYISKDVEADEAAYNELMGKTNGNYVGVPMTDIGGDMILGFDRPKIDHAIEEHGIKPVYKAA
ncbi:glutaredoxin [candidate division TM7 genomosp. GTL1]|nr:glutaredoxin [candidate division TM7 genomosp. GTL1]